MILAIKELMEEHIDENISEYIYSVAKEYNIMNKLRYFMMDNAGNNDMILSFLDEWIVDDDGMRFNPYEHQLCYFAHMINLAIQELIFDKKRTPKWKAELSEDMNKMTR